MPLRVLVFLAVILLVITGLHSYIGWRLRAHSRMGPRGRRWLRIVLVLSADSTFLAFVAGRLLGPGPLATTLNWIGFTAMGLVAILFALFVLRDVALLVGRLLARLGPGRQEREPHAILSDGGETRREVLLRGSNLAVLGLGGLIGAGSFVQAQRDPVVERVSIPVRDLPEALRGFRVAQVSDLHLGPTLGRPFLEHVVGRVNELGADLVAVTGDLIDGRVEDLAPVVEPLADLRGREGVSFVTGNHEYYWDAPAWVAHLRALGLEVLLNEHRLIRRGGSSLALAGVTDASAASILPSHASDPAKALAGTQDADVRLLLAHQPRSLYGAMTSGADVQLSGHTHGGQIFPMNLLVHLAHPIVVGLGRFGDTQVYVNRGTAYWGPPMRTGPRGEITLVELVPAG